LKTFYEADNVCQEYGGRLASFSSLGEVLSIAQGLLALQTQQGFANTHVWNGAKGTGSYYSFIDGTPWPVDLCTAYDCGRPWFTDCPEQGFDNENCLNFAVYSGTPSDASLSDDDGGCNIWNTGNKLWFLCKL
jgi:hypothetical protein